MSVTTDEARDLHVLPLVSGVTVTRNSGKSQCLTSVAYTDRFGQIARYRAQLRLLGGRAYGCVAGHMVEYPRSARRQESPVRYRSGAKGQ